MRTEIIEYETRCRVKRRVQEEFRLYSNVLGLLIKEYPSSIFKNLEIGDNQIKGNLFVHYSGYSRNITYESMLAQLFEYDKAVANMKLDNSKYNIELIPEFTFLSKYLNY
jgi:hypothetical protein